MWLGGDGVVTKVPSAWVALELRLNRWAGTKQAWRARRQRTRQREQVQGSWGKKAAERLEQNQQSNDWRCQAPGARMHIYPFTGEPRIWGSEWRLRKITPDAPSSKERRSWGDRQIRQHKDSVGSHNWMGTSTRRDQRAGWWRKLGQWPTT